MLSRLLIKWAFRTMENRPPDFKIGPSDDPYMKRWWGIPRNKYFNIYIHEIRHDDEDRALHDHPWPSLSLCCRGSLIEEYYYDSSLSADNRAKLQRFIHEGDWVYRSANFAHRLMLDPHVYSTPVTIFITGPRVREWGFLCAEAGWRHWKDFVNFNSEKGDTGTVGRGCGEIDLINEDGLLGEFHCRDCGEPEILQYANDSTICRRCQSKNFSRSSATWKISSIWLSLLGFSMLSIGLLLAWILS